MKKINLLMVFLMLLALSCNQVTVQEKKQDTLKNVKDGMLIHVSKGYDNPHKVVMALSLAVKISETYDVALFFDIKGVKLLTKTSEDIKMENFMGLHEALDKLVENKVLIMSCPMCTTKAGIKPEDLRDGVILAEKHKFFEFTKGRIVTLDY